MGIQQNLLGTGEPYIPIPDGAQSFTSAGSSTSWTVPANVTAISAVAIGSGGDAANGVPSGASYSGWTYSQGGIPGNGGNLAYSNNIPVTPGETLTVIVGDYGSTGGGANWSGTDGADGDPSGIKRGSDWILKAQGGNGGEYALTASYTTANGTSDSVGDVIRQGGRAYGYAGRQNTGEITIGGGGAAGYSGNGGRGGHACSHSNPNTRWALRLAPTDGSGGGGGGGCSYGTGGNRGFAGSGGGGTGIMGEGTSGAKGVIGNGQSPENYNTNGDTTVGGGGSGGSDGSKSQGGDNGGYGGNYGGGAGGPALHNRNIWGRGAQGAVRIIHGETRSYPNNADW